MILLCQTDPTVGQSERRARRFVALTERLGARACPSFFSVYLFCAVRCSARLAFCLYRVRRKGSPPPRGNISPVCLLSAAHASRPSAIFKPARSFHRARRDLSRTGKTIQVLLWLDAALRRYVPQSGDFLCKDRFFRAKNAFVRLPGGKNGVFLNFSQNIYKNV